MNDDISNPSNPVNLYLSKNFSDETKKNIASLNSIFEGIAFLQSKIEESCKKIADSPSNEDERNKLVSHLYWNFKELTAKMIAKSFGMKNASELLKHINAEFLKKQCEVCGAIGKFKHPSRTDSQFYCINCQNLKNENQYKQNREEHERKEYEQQQRSYELQTMPYREYLQTPEWQNLRIRKLKLAYFSCQLCNVSNVSLHVHHKTYERRGCEYLNDLIVLCHKCHEVFHSHHKNHRGY